MKKINIYQNFRKNYKKSELNKNNKKFKNIILSNYFDFEINFQNFISFKNIIWMNNMIQWILILVDIGILLNNKLLILFFTILFLMDLILKMTF